MFKITQVFNIFTFCGFRLGLNSILIYLLSCTGIAETVLTLVYWNDPDHNMSHLFFPTGMRKALLEVGAAIMIVFIDIAYLFCLYTYIHREMVGS